MKNKTANIKKIWSQATTSIELDRIQKAQDLLNKGIGLLGSLTISGISEIDGLSVDKWKEKFWKKLESIGGLDLGDDMDSVSDEEIYSAFVN